jgi:hypothetical protein
VLDLPRLLAQLRLSQSRPRLTAFKQLANSINQLLQLQQMVAALAPAAAAQAATGVDGGDGYTQQQQQQRSAGYGRASAVSCAVVFYCWQHRKLLLLLMFSTVAMLLSIGLQ